MVAEKGDARLDSNVVRLYVKLNVLNLAMASKQTNCRRGQG